MWNIIGPSMLLCVEWSVCRVRVRRVMRLSWVGFVMILLWIKKFTFCLQNAWMKEVCAYVCICTHTYCMYGNGETCRLAEQSVIIHIHMHTNIQVHMLSSYFLYTYIHKSTQLISVYVSIYAVSTRPARSPLTINIRTYMCTCMFSHTCWASPPLSGNTLWFTMCMCVYVYTRIVVCMHTCMPTDSSPVHNMRTYLFTHTCRQEIPSSLNPHHQHTYIHVYMHVYTYLLARNPSSVHNIRRYLFTRTYLASSPLGKHDVIFAHRLFFCT